MRKLNGSMNLRVVIEELKQKKNIRIDWLKKLHLTVFFFFFFFVLNN